MKSSFLTIAKFLIGWPLSLLALFFIFKVTSANFSMLASSLSHADLALLFWGIFCFVVYFFVRCYMWQHILKQHGHTLSFSQVSYLWSISEIRRYIPGNIWSFLSRTVLFHQKNVPKEVLVSALFTEAQLVTLGAVIFASFSLPFVSWLIPQIGLFSWLFPMSYGISFVLIGAYVFSKRFVKQQKGKNKSYFSAILPQFDATTNAKQLLVVLISFVLFGLGSYLTASSIVFLSPEHLIGFSMFFVFAFFVGYISLITPMGIGVREGVITIGLAQVVSSGTAAVVAIFIRIIFILSELLALGIAYLWIHTKSTWITRIENYVSSHIHETILAFGILIYSIYFTTASFLRFANFFTGRFDLGNMDQTVWNSLQGKIFMFTNPDGTEIVSRMIFHADVILVLLAPLYLLWEDPRMLLIAQTIVLSLGSCFVFAISQKVLGKKSLSLTFALVYLLNPSLQYTNLYDFHAVTFATTFLLGTFYFAMKKQMKLFFLFAILAGLCKEQIWLIIALFGLYFFFIQKKRLLGISIFFIFLGITYYVISVLIPGTRGSSHFALTFYAELGDSPIGIIKTVLFSPDKFIGILFEDSRLEYLKRLFMPLGFVSLFAPVALIFVAPDFMINLLSSNNNFHQIYYQYTATITPFLFISGMYGARYIQKRFFLKDTYLIGYLLCMAVLSAYLYGPIPGSKNASHEIFSKSQPNREFIAASLSAIPQQYRVAATNNLGAHLSHRDYLYTIPLGMDKADVITFLLGDKFAQPSPNIQHDMVDALKKNPEYILKVEKGNFFLFEKKNLPKQ